MLLLLTVFNWQFSLMLGRHFEQGEVLSRGLLQALLNFAKVLLQL